MVNLIWTDRAKKALKKIHDFISEDSPKNADSVILTIINATKKLKQLPNLGRFVPELEDSITHELIVLKKYRTIYEIKDETIYILNILHTSQQFQK